MEKENEFDKLRDKYSELEYEDKYKIKEISELKTQLNDTKK